MATQQPKPTLSTIIESTTTVKSPESLVYFDGKWIIVSPQSNSLYEIDIDNRQLKLFAGQPETFKPGNDNGPLEKATFSSPQYLVVHPVSGDLYISQGRSLRVITKEKPHQVSTFAGVESEGCVDGDALNTATFGWIKGMVFDSKGNLFVVDYAGQSIRKIYKETNGYMVTTFAGSFGKKETGSTDGTGTNARFNYPNGIVIDKEDNLFVADTNNNTIRKITPDAAVTTFAGTAGAEGNKDDKGANARFKYPNNLVIDDNGTLLVADKHNEKIRKITKDAVVTTVVIPNETGPKPKSSGFKMKNPFGNPFGLTLKKNNDGGVDLFIIEFFTSTCIKLLKNVGGMELN